MSLLQPVLGFQQRVCQSELLGGGSTKDQDALNIMWTHQDGCGVTPRQAGHIGGGTTQTCSQEDTKCSPIKIGGGGAGGGLTAAWSSQPPPACCLITPIKASLGRTGVTITRIQHQWSSLKCSLWLDKMDAAAPPHTAPPARDDDVNVSSLCGN